MVPSFILLIYINRGQSICYPSKALSRLTQLTSLTWAHIPEAETQEDETVDSNGLEIENGIEFNGIVVANASNLRRLTYAGDDFWRLPVRSLSSLTELDIIDPINLSGLDIVFRHATQLRDVRLSGTSNNELFASLQRNSSALPHLRSLSLSSDVEECNVEEGQAIARFIEGRPLLQRLELKFHFLYWTAFTRVLPSPRDTKGLKVLGLGCGVEYISSNLSETLREYLTDDLEAVSLNLPWVDNVQISNGPLADLVRLFFFFLSGTSCFTLKTVWQIDRLAVLHGLTFFKLAVFNEVEIWPLAEQFAIELKHIKLLCLNNSFWDIERVAAEVVMMQWPYQKKVLKLREDFSTKDAEWLVR